ncbi:MAG: hypothetical protein ACHREM_01100 [Polyangiales bacterium]
MEQSTVRGEHMALDVFDRALAFTRRVEGLAWSMGCPPLILLSGGEATEHPDIEKMIERVYAARMIPWLLTNGSWLADPARRASLLRPEWTSMEVQVTHDPRFYPTSPPVRVVDPRLRYVESITKLLPLGRAARKTFDNGVPKLGAPSSFNIRSITRSFGSIERALVEQRLRAMLGKAGHCSPSISADGSVVAGESNACFKVGTVDSTNQEITDAMINMRCNACGLVDNLTFEQKRAIGESLLVSPYEH